MDELKKAFDVFRHLKAVRTAAQAALSLIGVNVLGVTDVNWIGVASAAALAAILSILLSLSDGTGFTTYPDEP